MLSAQTTDVNVNRVTEQLFVKYRRPEDYLAVPQEELEQDIFQTGFYRQKAKSIRGAMRVLLEEFDGEVPRTIPELLRLPGVARKTANVVAAELGDAQGIVVDTHVRRLSQRLGLTREEDPVKIERDLVKIVPRADWHRFPHLLIWHGRRVCDARKPRCEECVLADLCPREPHTRRLERADGDAQPARRGSRPHPVLQPQVVAVAELAEQRVPRRRARRAAPRSPPSRRARDDGDPGTVAPREADRREIRGVVREGRAASARAGRRLSPRRLGRA